MSIADLPHAVLHEVAVNEIAFDQKHNLDGTPTLDDPIKLRLGAFIPAGRAKYYIGCIGFDVLRMKDGKVHRTEVGFLKFAVDEVVDGDGDPVPMVELFLTRATDDSTDAAEDRVVTASRKGVRFHVPLFANTVGTVHGRVRRFYSDDGRFCYVVQGPASGQPDGALVQYNTHDTDDELQWEAVGTMRSVPV